MNGISYFFLGQDRSVLQRRGKPVFFASRSRGLYDVMERLSAKARLPDAEALT